MEHYLDNSATTKVSQAAAKAAVEVMLENYGNPSSLHLMGYRAEQTLEKARESVAAALRAEPGEIYFTSGGTEANNLAIFGAAEAKKRRGRRVVVSAVEHSSVLDSAKRLDQMGFDVKYVRPREDGAVYAEDFAALVNEETILVSAMCVNNETGAVMNVPEIFAAARSITPDVICHTDAVQAFGKVKLNVSALNADLLTVSGHKIHAPKGVGALYVKKGVRILPQHYGGEQEKRMRPGTEPLALIAAMGAACGEFDIDLNYRHILRLNALARQKLTDIDGVLLNSPRNALPYVLNVSVGRVRSETMLHFLEEREIYVSSGSACAKGKPSHVLSAMGLDKRRADSALRISFSKLNTREDVLTLCEGVRDGMEQLVQS